MLGDMNSQDPIDVIELMTPEFLFRRAEEEEYPNPKIDDITRGKHHPDIYKIVGTVPISYGDIERLKPSGRLNDSIIQAFIDLLMEFTRRHGIANCFLFSLHFTSYVKSGEEDGIKRYLRSQNIDFSSLENFLFPVNCNDSHWVTVVVRKSFKTIEIYDSDQGLPSITPVEDLAELFQDYEVIKVLVSYVIAQLNVDASEWICIFMECPQQTNFDDCGVHLCLNSLCVALDFDVHFDANKVSTFRRYMVQCLSQAELIPARV